MASVAFTPNLQRHLSLETVQAHGATVAELLAEVFGQHPALKHYLLDDQGALRKHVTVFVDAVNVRDRRTLSDPVGPRSEVFVAQALSGG